MPSKQELRWMIGSLAGINIGNITIFSSPIYIGSLIDGFGFNESQAGLISTIEIGSVAVTCLLLSRWLGQISLRYLAAAGALITLVANVASIELVEFLPIVLVRALAGFGAGLCLAATSALLSRMKDPDQMVGIMLAVNTIIMIVIITVLGYVKEQWEFAGVMTVFAIDVVLFLPLLVLLPVTALDAIPKNTDKIETANPHLMLGILGISLLFFFCIVEGGIWAFGERSGSNLGLSDGDIGLLLALAQSAGFVGAVLAAVFGARIPRIYPISVGTLMMGLAGLNIYQTDSPLVYGIFLAVFSFGFFVAFPYLVGACARLDADGRWAARANGINLLGGAISPLIAATIITSSDYQTLGSYCFGLAVFCLVLALIFNRELNRANIDESQDLEVSPAP